jgi:RNA polymerase sigma factor (sigma-70 family)
MNVLVDSLRKRRNLWLGGCVGLAELSDGQLVMRCRARDQAAWGELVDRFSRYVWAIATQAYRLSDSDAEELVQEVFSRTHQHLDRLRNDDAIRPWIGQLARRLAIDRLRANKREQVTDELPEVADADPTLERLAEAMDVRTALAGLPDNCREILDRFFARDESYDTIGATLGIPPGTIASRISRCLGRLREALTSREAVTS